ncbi:MAG: cytochrome c3 family protein [Candidatus Bipolaricaulota bacterium]|nr:cytochrome c3 family protein [Candidatus Bipolaricaulota bacterium]MDW8030344.1 cytochrome c3 family protein [Candidatus Bipolaricaulota bacterium]
MRRRWLVLTLIALAILIWLAWAGARATDQPSFCASCHYMKPFYDNWASSSHAMVNCIECHYERGFAGYIKGKIRLVSEIIRYWIGVYTVQPHSRVSDHNCLSCHEEKALAQISIYHSMIPFSHAKHYGVLARGIELTCTTCHSQLVQGDHLAVDANACTACHFIGVTRGNALGDCYSCHGPPKDQILIRGIVFNHSEYLKSEVDCLTCHVHVTRGRGDVPREKCFSCHVERPEGYDKPELIHRTHVTKEHFKCTDCHTRLEHGKFELAQALAPECTTCHGGRHTVQEQIYIGTGGLGVEPMPDPMFLSGVVCAGCHQSRMAPSQACVTCHGAGYDRLMRQWQKFVSHKLSELREQLAQLEPTHSPKLYEEIRKNLELIEEDRSLGVHNIHYVSALLRHSAENVARLRALQEQRAYSAEKPGHTGEPFGCNRCHVGVELLPIAASQTASHQVHLQRADCNTCHAVQAAEHGQTFASARDCTQCHPAADQMAQLEPQDCLQCHEARLSRPSGRARFPHEVHVALGVRCEACHEGVTRLGHLEFLGQGLPQPGHTFCATCHPTDRAELCSQCHSSF